LLVGGCVISTDVTAPRIDSVEPAGLGRIPGRYVIAVRGGRWRLDQSSTTGGRCAGYRFNYFADDAFEAAAKTSLTGLLESVEFVEAPLMQRQLPERGYDAEIIVEEGSASVELKLFNFIHQAAVSLDVKLGVVDPSSSASPQAFPGSGFASRTSDLSCGAAGDIAAEAFQKALREALRGITAALRDRLRPRGRSSSS
jgi:hypothetical protein